jgi:hypothetical protein
VLTLRSTGLTQAYANWLDYVIVEAGRTVGRLYEDHHSPPEYRWFWSITVYVNPMLGITTNGRTATLAKLMNLVRHDLGFGSNTWDRGSHPWPLRDRSADLRALGQRLPMLFSETRPVHRPAATSRPAST